MMIPWLFLATTSNSEIRTVKLGKASWELWRSRIMPLTEKWTINTKYTLVEQSSSSFPSIPIWDFQMRKGYHVGSQIGTMCQEHYQRRSFLVSNTNKTCCAVGVLSLGPEVGAPGDAIPADIEPHGSPKSLRKQKEDDGWVVIRDIDTVEIVEAKGESHKFIADDLKHLTESMAQTLHQMNMTAKANLRNQARSAQSKAN